MARRECQQTNTMYSKENDVRRRQTIDGTLVDTDRIQVAVPFTMAANE